MKRIIIGLAGVLLFSGSVWALTPQQLKENLNQGAKLTIIDVRSTHQYTEGHIPGAINIPAAVIGKKRLPPLGEVVVYGDGVRNDVTEKAAAELNAKAGIRAEVLEGGLPGWEALKLATTHPSGLSQKRTRFVSYEELEAAAAGNPDIIFVDLREGTKGAAAKGRTALEDKFAGHRQIKVERRQKFKESSWDVSGVIRGIGGRGNAHRYLCVLVDDGDGQAEEVARRLHAAGITRVAILTGGEEALSREGKTQQVTTQSKTTPPKR
jgi:rhodanese-related sulfurtransferase